MASLWVLLGEVPEGFWVLNAVNKNFFPMARIPERQNSNIAPNNIQYINLKKSKPKKKLKNKSRPIRYANTPTILNELNLVFMNVYACL